MICNSGTAFAARVDGRRLSFEEVGITNGVFVMKDRQTGTLWSHYTGEALDGPLKGKRLDWVQLQRASTEDLLERAPRAEVPKTSTMRFKKKVPRQTGRSVLGEKMPPNFAPTLPDHLKRSVPFHAHGLGVAVGSSHRFYPLEQLYQTEVVSDRIGEVDLVVFIQDGSATAAAYSRCVDGTVLAFEAVDWKNQRA